MAAAIVIVGVSLSGEHATLYFWATVAIMALYATSVNLLIGYSGIPSFGQAAYFGLGAYTVGLLSSGAPAPMLAAILLGGVVAAVAALAVALVGLRVSGLAFSMLTLAFAQALFTLTFRLPLLGGENGFVGIIPQRVLGLDLGRDPLALWLSVVVLVAIGIAALRLVVVSPFGRTLRMIRDDVRRTSFLGIPVFRYQTATFVIAGFVAGICGAVYAYLQGVVGPDYLFWTRSGEPIIMSIVGGMRHFAGPIVGAVVYMWTVDTLSKQTAAWVLWVGIAFLAVVIAAPDGILGFPATVRRWRALLLRRRVRGLPPAAAEAKPE
ncbi:MAG: branched-chain amino acid ABC transporter permease [Chloroflexota bacterium]|nr:branched-chain amino acid ABC transporter permease [Chloroflexota bacterium]